MKLPKKTQPYFFFHPQTSNTVYEIVSDMASRQDALEEKLTTLEDKLQTIQVSITKKKINLFEEDFIITLDWIQKLFHSCMLGTLLSWKVFLKNNNSQSLSSGA